MTFHTAELAYQDTGKLSRRYTGITASGNANIVIGDIYHGSDIAPQSKPDDYKILFSSIGFERMDARLVNIRPASPKTCTWLFEDPTYLAWRNAPADNQQRAFLWIKGKPGSGKSTIMKTALRRAEREKSNALILHYFFNARASSDLEKSTLGLYRSLVFQLLESVQSSHDGFVSTFRWKIKSDGSIDPWTINELQDFLLTTIQEIGDHPITFFIDALDEGVEEDVRQMVEFLDELAAYGSEAGRQVRICLSSRHYPHITIKNGEALIVDDQATHYQDIRTYTFARLTNQNNSDLHDLAERVCQRASGIFLWVVLVSQILKQAYEHGKSVANLESQLDALPVGLDGLFANLMQPDAENGYECCALLQWVLCAFRPLHPSELYIGVRHRFESLCIAEHDVPQKDHLQRYLVHNSRGLVEITKSWPPAIQFIHETVREFLLKPEGLATLMPAIARNVIGFSHEFLTTSCLNYVKQCITYEKQISDGLISKRAGPLLLLDYASIHIFRHADTAQACGISQEHFLKQFSYDPAFLDAWKHVTNAWEQYGVTNYKKVSFLRILSEARAPHLVEKLLREESSFFRADERAKDLQTALYNACVTGDEHMARQMLQKDVDPDVEYGELGLPVIAAIVNRHDNLVELLRPVTKSLTEKVLTGYLHNMIAAGRTGSIDALADFGVTVEHGTEDFRGPVLRGTMVANGTSFAESMYRFRLGEPTDLGWLDTDLELFETRPATVKYLNTLGHHYNTLSQNYKDAALYQASEGRDTEYVYELYEAGANVNRLASNGSYPIHTAAQRGSPDMLATLIVAGADVNAAGLSGMTATMCAVSGGYVPGGFVPGKPPPSSEGQSEDPQAEKMGILMRANADLGLKNNAGRNTLDIAIANNTFGQYSSVITLLREAGLEESESESEKKKKDLGDESTPVDLFDPRISPVVS